MNVCREVICREGVWTSKVVWGKGEGEGGGGADEQRRGNPISSKRNSKIIGGVVISYQDAPNPHSLPSTTRQTGKEGKTLKRRDVDQAVRGGKVLSVSQTGSQTGRRPMTTVADGGQQTQRQVETEGRP